MASYCSVKALRERLCDIFGSESIQISREDVKEARSLMELAGDAAKIVLPYARGIASEIGLLSKEAVVNGPIKKLDRIFEKAIGKLDGQIDQIPDVGRLRILIKSPEDVIALERLFLDKAGRIKETHPHNKIEVVEFENYFRNPSKTGRIAIHIGLEVKLSGSKTIPFEIQVIDHRMEETEKGTHRDYIKSQEIERRAKRENRQLTPEEEQARDAYRAGNRERYIADALNYGYYPLRHARPGATNSRVFSIAS